MKNKTNLIKYLQPLIVSHGLISDSHLSFPMCWPSWLLSFWNFKYVTLSTYTQHGFSSAWDTGKIKNAWCLHRSVVNPELKLKVTGMMICVTVTPTSYRNYRTSFELVILCVVFIWKTSVIRHWCDFAYVWLFLYNRVT